MNAIFIVYNKQLMVARFGPLIALHYHCNQINYCVYVQNRQDRAEVA